jgi:hypothetical protein
VEGARRLKPERIEARAAVLLLQYESRFGRIRRPPVPVDEILEHLLKLSLEFDDLRKSGLEAAHAVMYREERRVVIDERLDPVEHPEMEGRFNFTVAHEIGHIWLRHPPIHGLRFGDSSQPQFISSYQELEWQADKFASYLLMPKSLVMQEWRAKYGDTEPLRISEEMEYAARVAGFSRAEFVKGFAEEHAREFAQAFKVSVDAMRIRLQELHLLPRQ